MQSGDVPSRQCPPRVSPGLRIHSVVGWAKRSVPTDSRAATWARFALPTLQRYQSQRDEVLQRRRVDDFDLLSSELEPALVREVLEQSADHLAHAAEFVGQCL